MKTVKFFLPLLITLSGYTANSQDKSAMEGDPAKAKLIAVVNRAAWCEVCKANGDRAGALLMSYVCKGVTIYINDLTDSTTTATSKTMLQAAHLYDAVYTIPRKGMGGLFQHCGLLKGKSQTSLATGIITFVDPTTHKSLGRLSIAVPS